MRSTTLRLRRSRRSPGPDQYFPGSGKRRSRQSEGSGVYGRTGIKAAGEGADKEDASGRRGAELEEAASLRDQMIEIKKLLLEMEE